MLEEIIESIREATEGMAEEEITAELEQCSNVLPEDVPRLASWIASLNA